jgi:hypothetical protein
MPTYSSPLRVMMSVIPLANPASALLADWLATRMIPPTPALLHWQIVYCDCIAERGETNESHFPIR